MDKMYITKTKLQELLNQTLRQGTEYPKPLLTLFIAIISIVIIGMILIAMFIIVVVAVLYAMLSWLDTLIGKYILKRIFK